MSEVMNRPRKLTFADLCSPQPQPKPTAEPAAPPPPKGSGNMPRQPGNKFDRRRQAALAALRLFRERWPGVFSFPPSRPLAIGIDREIMAALPDIPPHTISHALGVHTKHGAYVNLILEVGPRYDLNGDPAGEVTIEQVESLKASRARRRPHGRATKTRLAA